MAVTNDQFEVEAIRAKRLIKTKSGEDEYEYRVKWVGYPESDNTWEPLSNLAGSMWYVDQFEMSMKKEEKNGAKVEGRKTTSRKRKASEPAMTFKRRPSTHPTKRVPKINKDQPTRTSETIYYNGLIEKLDEPFEFSSKEQLKEFLFKKVLIPQKGKCFTAEAGRITRLALEAQVNGYFNEDDITEIINISVDLQIRSPPRAQEKLAFAKEWRLENGDDAEVPKLAKCGEAKIPGHNHTCKW